MLGTLKVFLTLLALTADIRPAEADAAKRDLNGQQPGIEFLHLGHFGPISRLPSHPTFAPLGLTPQQTVGFLRLLFQNALLAPHALRLPNGHPLAGDFFAPQFGPNWLPPLSPPIDPYFLFLMANYARFLPYGLGPHGFYGSTGLPKPSPFPPLSLVFRHGDRAPVGSYPKDPYSDVSCWPNGWGQLTKLGKLQQYELGKWIRHRYWDFLPARYNASDIYVRSTDVDRTLVSAYCNLAGIYECWSADGIQGLPWQPVPVHTTPVDMDSVLAAHKKCPAYDHLLEDVLKTEEVCTINDHYHSVFCNLSQHTGLQITSVRDCVFLYATLNIQTLHGLQLPYWTRDYFPEPLREIAEFAFKLPCYTTPLKRLKCGPLLKDIISHMDDSKAGKLPQKMWIYSAHDTTLANLMQCLGVFDGSIPPYTATIIFELFRRQDDYFVIVSYKTPNTLRTLRLPCCDSTCPFQDFKRLLRPLLPTDWERECLAESPRSLHLLHDHSN